LSLHDEPNSLPSFWMMVRLYMDELLSTVLSW
jgi:hypothetical protein